MVFLLSKMLYNKKNNGRQVKTDKSNKSGGLVMNQKVMAFKEHTLAKIEPILEGMPGGLFIYRADETEELLYINSAVLRIFGCETDEEFRTLTGYTFKGMVHPEDLDEVEQSIQTQIANSFYAFDYVEYRIIQKDGTIRWFED